MGNKYFSRFIMLVMAVVFSVSSFAADKITVTGSVTGPNKKALSEVVVTDINTNTQATTNKRGIYKIETSSDATLSYSMIGAEFAVEQVDGRTSIDVVYGQLSEEGIAVGYGTQDRDNITNAVSSVNPEGLSEAPSTGLAETLRGKSAGLNITSANEAGASSTISLRGMVSLSAGASPLVIVDGFPMPDGLDAINSADVASVEVLKDAASASIYGARAAGGVILVTTKMGQAENEAKAAALAEARAKAKAERAEAKAAKAAAKAAKAAAGN